MLGKVTRKQKPLFEDDDSEEAQDSEDESAARSHRPKASTQRKLPSTFTPAVKARPAPKQTTKPVTKKTAPKARKPAAKSTATKRDSDQDDDILLLSD